MFRVEPMTHFSDGVRSSTLFSQHSLAIRILDLQFERCRSRTDRNAANSTLSYNPLTYLTLRYVPRPVNKSKAVMAEDPGRKRPGNILRPLGNGAITLKARKVVYR